MNSRAIEEFICECGTILNANSVVGTWLDRVRLE